VAALEVDLVKTILVLIALAATLAAPPAQATDVTVHLDVTVLNAAPLADCDVTVPAGSNVGVVLDQAVEDGCILEWSNASFPGFGRYVTSIDHVHEAVATYWAFYVDGEYSDFGIDSTFVEEGASYRFDYTQWVVPV
jgi:hypothetical protein